MSGLSQQQATTREQEQATPVVEAPEPVVTTPTPVTSRAPGSDTPILDGVSPEAGAGWSNGAVEMNDGGGGRYRIGPGGVSTGTVTRGDGFTEQNTVGVNRNGDVTGTYGRKNEDGSSSGVGITVTGDGASVSGSRGFSNGVNVGVSGSFSYDDDVSRDVTTADRADPISHLIDPAAMDGIRTDAVDGVGGDFPGYHLDGRSMSWSVGANGGYRGVEVEASYRAASQFNVFTEGQEGLSAEEAHARNEALLADAGGIADLGLFTDAANPFGDLAVGQGVNWQSENGWNAGVKGSYGAMGLGVGVMQQTGHAVTMQRTGEGTMQLSVRNGQTDGFSLSPEVAGLGATFESQLTDAETTTFDIDAEQLTDDGRAQLQTFLETGLLPGASSLEGEEAAQANQSFTESRAEIDRIDADLAALQARMDAGSISLEDHDAHLAQLQSARFEAGARVEQATAELNATWREQNAGARDIGIPGVTIQRDESSQTRTSRADLLGVEGLGMERSTTWTEASYLQANGEMGTELRYRDESGGNWFANPRFDETMANTEGTWQMGSQLDVREGSVEAGIVDGIAISTLPEYMQEAAREGNLPWETMEEAQVVLSLDEPTVMALGDALSEGEAGADLWADMSARNSALFDVAERFTDPNADRTGHGARGIYDEWRAEGLIGDHENYDIDTTQAMGMAAQGIADAGGLVMPGGGMSRLPAGMSPGEVSQIFAGIDGPESFQALRESHPESYQDLQDLYVDAAIRTSVENNPYEAVAAITLIEDPRMRAEKMTEMFAVLQSDIRDTVGGGTASSTQNPTLQFVDLAERAAVSSPELQAAIDRSIAFDWAPERTRELEGRPAAEIAAAITGARDAQSGGVLGFFQSPDVDERGAVEALWAANNSGNLREVMQATGMDTTQVLDMLQDDPLLQRMAGDVLSGLSASEVEAYFDEQG